MNKPTLTPDQHRVAADLLQNVIRDAMDCQGNRPSPEQFKEIAITAATAFMAAAELLNAAVLLADPVPPAAS
jgi:hypothetical protein